MEAASFISGCADNLLLIAKHNPRVHCITNAVAMNYSANMLLSVGAVPSMTLSVDEVADFVAGAGALTVNIGMLDEQRLQAIPLAVNAARHFDKRWVLDPVLVHVSRARRNYARDLLLQHPAVIRGNAAEIACLAGTQEQSAQVLAQRAACIVAQTGATDTVTDGQRSIEIHNGHPLMNRVTAMGCALSALISGFLAVESDSFAATAQAVLVLTVAGEIAAESAAGPGSFQGAILDALYRLDRTQLEQRSRLQ